MKTFITRAEYMANSLALHHAYYSQFVSDALKNAVGECIGVARIKASTDSYLNDIPLHEWDAIKGLVFAHCAAQLKKVDPCGVSLGSAVCIAKAAAQMIKEEQ